ncbi:MAG: hypothetical protein KC502_01925 [Myxococcales bacterium]|nr:hypothetical protein [Myxococcales bacterium]
MQRMIGLLLLSLGTGIAAVFGAWLPGGDSADHRARMEAQAHLDMATRVDKDLKKTTDESARKQLTALAGKVGPMAPKGADGKPLAAPRGADGVSMWAGEAGLPFGLGVLLVIIGVVLARRGISAEAAANHTDSATSGTATGPLLEQLVTETAGLCAQYTDKDELPDLMAVRTDVERVQQQIVSPLVEGRGQISQEYGVAAYAEVFVPFSAAERLLNRAWSASVDEYVDEIAPCLVKASASAQQALAAYQLVSKQAS